MKRRRLAAMALLGVGALQCRSFPTAPRSSYVGGRRAVVVGLLLVASVSACGPTQLGAAAIVEDERITVTEVQGALKSVRALQERFGLPVDQSATAARNEVRRRIVAMVFEQAAADLRVILTPGEVADRYAQERSQFDSDEAYARALAERNLTPAVLDREYRQALLAEKMGERIQDEGGEELSEQELQTALGEHLIETAAAMDIKVNPRYGRFDEQEGLIKPVQFDFFRDTLPEPTDIPTVDE